MIWGLAAGVLVAFLVLAGVALASSRNRGARIASPEAAADAADAALPGFRTTGAVVGSDGVVALMVDAEDRVAVCRRNGARLTVDEVTWKAVRATGDGLLIDVGERRSGSVTVAGVDALDVRRLRGQHERNAVSASPM